MRVNSSAGFANYPHRRKEIRMRPKIVQFQKKSFALMILLMIMGSLVAGCASESTSYKKDTTQNVNGQTVVVEKEESKSSEHHGHAGILGGALHMVGEVLAFPFEVIAGAFRFIF